MLLALSVNANRWPVDPFKQALNMSTDHFKILNLATTASQVQTVRVDKLLTNGFPCAVPVKP